MGDGPWKFDVGRQAFSPGIGVKHRKCEVRGRRPDGGGRKIDRVRPMSAVDPIAQAKGVFVQLPEFFEGQFQIHGT
jgi:hypothetical protein